MGAACGCSTAGINPGPAGHDCGFLPHPPWQDSGRGTMRCRVSWQSHAEWLGTIRVLCWADWFTAGSCRHIPAAQTHCASGMSPDPLLSPAFPPHRTGAAGHPGPGAGLLRAHQRQTGQHPHRHPEGGEDQPDLRECALGSHLQAADQPQVRVLPGGAHCSGHAAHLCPGVCWCCGAGQQAPLGTTSAPCSPLAWKGHSRGGAEPSQPPKIVFFQGEASGWCQIHPGSATCLTVPLPFSSWTGCAMASARALL